MHYHATTLCPSWGEWLAPFPEPILPRKASQLLVSAQTTWSRINIHVAAMLCSEIEWVTLHLLPEIRPRSQQSALTRRRQVPMPPRVLRIREITLLFAERGYSFRVRASRERDGTCLGTRRLHMTSSQMGTKRYPNASLSS